MVAVFVSLTLGLAAAELAFMLDDSAPTYSCMTSAMPTQRDFCSSATTSRGLEALVATSPTPSSTNPTPPKVPLSAARQPGVSWWRWGGRVRRARDSDCAALPTTCAAGHGGHLLHRDPRAHPAYRIRQTALVGPDILHRHRRLRRRAADLAAALGRRYLPPVVIPVVSATVLDTALLPLRGYHFAPTTLGRAMITDPPATAHPGSPADPPGWSACPTQ